MKIGQSSRFKVVLTALDAGIVAQGSTFNTVLELIFFLINGVLGVPIPHLSGKIWELSIFVQLWEYE